MSKTTKKADQFLNNVVALAALEQKTGETVAAFVESKILPAFFALGLKAGEAIPAETRKGAEFKALRDTFKRGYVMHYRANVAAEIDGVDVMTAYLTGKASPEYKALDATTRANYDRAADRVSAYVDQAFRRNIVVRFPEPKAEPKGGEGKASKAGRGRGKGEAKAEGGEAGAADVMPTWAQVRDVILAKVEADGAKATNEIAVTIKLLQNALKAVTKKAA